MTTPPFQPATPGPAVQWSFWAGSYGSAAVAKGYFCVHYAGSVNKILTFVLAAYFGKAFGSTTTTYMGGWAGQVGRYAGTWFGSGVALAGTFTATNLLGDGVALATFMTVDAGAHRLYRLVMRKRKAPPPRRFSKLTFAAIFVPIFLFRCWLHIQILPYTHQGLRWGLTEAIILWSGTSTSIGRFTADAIGASLATAHTFDAAWFITDGVGLILAKTSHWGLTSVWELTLPVTIPPSDPATELPKEKASSEV